ncbi:MAG: hypothetical protein ACKV22_41970 [Bryobacteraceae bacterium]
MRIRANSIILQLVLAITSSPVTAQVRQPPDRSLGPSRPESLQTDKPSPILEVLNMVERRYGWHVTFEEAPFENPEDIVDRRTPEQVKANPTGPPWLAVKWRPLRVDYRVLERTGEPDRREFMTEAMRAYMTSRNPGVYKFVESGDITHIQPALFRRKPGALEPTGSILDARVSFPAEPRDGYRMVLTILDSIAAVRRVQIVSGTLPTNALRQTRVDWGANNEEARTLLFKLFADMNSQRDGKIRITWRILYDVEQKQYWFNAHIVTRERPNAFGGVTPEWVK